MLIQQAPISLPKRGLVQPVPARPSGHRDYLDGLRAMAALWVVLSHLWISQCGMNAHTGRLGLATNWTLYSHFAVDIFIVLSGFCLILPVERDGCLQGGGRAFFLRRARRILPPFYAALALSVVISFLLQMLMHQAPMLNRRALLVNLLLLQDLYLPLNIFNGPFWSIAVEWRIYFLFPALVWLLRRRGKKAVLAAAAVFGGAVTLALIRWQPEMLLACPWYLLLFSLGLCAGATSHSPALRSPGFNLLCFLLAAFCCIVLFFMLHVHPITTAGGKEFGRYLPLLDSVVGIAASALLLNLTHRPGYASLLCRRPLVMLGTFAYSLYLIHMPCLLLFSRLLTLWRPSLTDPLMRVLALSLTLPLIIGLAYLFFLAFEKPFLRRSTARFPKNAGMLSILNILADNRRTTQKNYSKGDEDQCLRQ